MLIGICKLTALHGQIERYKDVVTYPGVFVRQTAFLYLVPQSLTLGTPDTQSLSSQPSLTTTNVENWLTGQVS